MKIALDIDGVLRDFTGQLTKVYKEDFPDHEVKPIETWYFHESFPIGKEIYKYYVEQGDRIFRYAKAYEGASDFVESLKKLGHEVIYLTSQPNQLLEATHYWIINNLPEADAVVFTNKKWLVDFDILLDDAPHNIQEVKEKNKLGVFYTQKWNEDISNMRVHSYKEFLEMIIDMEEVWA